MLGAGIIGFAIPLALGYALHVTRSGRSRLLGGAALARMTPAESGLPVRTLLDCCVSGEARAETSPQWRGTRPRLIF